MNVDFSLTASCKVRVLLVPVSPIKRSTFEKYVELVKAFEIVRLGDVTPDLKKGASAMFNSQAFQEGQMHFEFLNHRLNQHKELEAFQPYRRIFGVIGIMDCQEWEKKGLKEGYHQFVHSLDHYPSSVVTRCFAFEPSETQEDDTKGLIMIPNIGNMSFYMSTMIYDFASEVLELFSTLANSIQSSSVIESPLALDIPIKHRDQQRLSQPPLAAYNREYSLSKRASLPMTPTRASEEENRTKKRTAGRIQKLLADFYLLAGRLPDAIHYYDQAIESTKTMSDFLWLASAMEGWLCATFLLEHLQIDIGHIVSRTTPYMHSTDSPTGQVELPPTPTTPKASRSTLDLFMEQYSLIYTYYNRVTLTASLPTPDIVFAESCMRIARVLTTAYLNDGWNETTAQLIMQGKLSQGDIEKNKHSLSGIARYHIGDWVTKIWKTRIDQMGLLNQISLFNGMSLIYSCIGYHRKAAWTMHQSVKCMLPLTIQYRRSNLARNKTSDQGVLDMLRKICGTYGIGESVVQLGNPGLDDNDAVSSCPQFGWPALQIEILKQCISVSEALIDNGLRLYYTNVLLRRLYQFLPKVEQMNLATTIEVIIVQFNRDKKAVPTSMNYWGINLVSSIELKKPISRKAVYAHSIKKEVVEEKKALSDDPFIYNPYVKKQDTSQKVVLVKNELSEFHVSLLNPFGFDLELQSIVLSTSGVEFEAVPTGSTIPANTTTQIQLTGTPKEAGVLVIRGCLIRIVGFTEQEFTVNSKSTKSSDHSRHAKIKSSGLKTLDLKTDRGQAKSSEEEQFITMNVIEQQSLFKIKRSSLLHGAIMLFEGEVAHMTMDLENIGNTYIDFIALSFVDSTTSIPMFGNSELLPEEQYELELYTKGTRVFSWADTINTQHGQLTGRKVWLSPGSSITIKVNIYGKRNCHHGTVQIDYGLLERSSEAEASLFYTRQLYYNVLVTVYQNLECSNWDIAYLRHSIPASNSSTDLAIKNMHDRQMSHKHAMEDLLLMTRNIKIENQDFCLVTLDIQNIWSAVFDVEFIIEHETLEKDEQVTFQLPIQPGSTVRVILPIKRLFLPLDVCHQAIPSLDVNRQFVVSQGPKLSKDQQQARLQMFWYREELLNRIKASWRLRGSDHTGHLNLRPSLRLSQAQLAIFKKEDIEFLIQMEGQSVKRLGHRRFVCECNDLTTLRITVKNRFPHPMKMILRLQPVQSYNDGVKEYDLTEKLLIEGVKQIVLPEAWIT
ncbi:TRAPP II complex [Blakeslea trispora]|nr:TRAPP II complex [Blakeslea trispora]